eukprot:CAMPEP_0119052152 /NCGR_PEP_ID=MMETSP1177-20130426/73552_1 /TAXON_ID=2985 /ORGANISM="Ochromonas sp, Strain CCMP1899" /LENGTH=150 /DNA_ID=CAMNT_0007031635 /DNA_START=577 /DNA_END=1029 /DNA_ORIENTATION=+
MAKFDEIYCELDKKIGRRKSHDCSTEVSGMDSDENRDVSSSPKRNLKIVIENDPNTHIYDNETTSEAYSSPVSSRLRSSPTKSSPMNLGVGSTSTGDASLTPTSLTPRLESLTPRGDQSLTPRSEPLTPRSIRAAKKDTQRRLSTLTLDP